MKERDREVGWKEEGNKAKVMVKKETEKRRNKGNN